VRLKALAAVGRQGLTETLRQAVFALKRLIEGSSGDQERQSVVRTKAKYLSMSGCPDSNASRDFLPKIGSALWNLLTIYYIGHVGAGRRDRPLRCPHRGRRARGHATLPLNKFSLPNLQRVPAFGPIGACAYTASFAVPFAWDISLVVLALSSVLATVFSSRNRLPASLPLVFPVLVFLVATGLAVLVSEKMGRSVQLSAPLLPAVLLFFLIADHFHGPRDTRLLYLAFSVVGLGLASVLLWTVWRDGWVSPRTWVSEMGSPMLVVPNDVIFLAVVAPLSLALLYRNTISP
jgi:hypothetical protein